jgi:PTH2 family peptidyl-tRNA hydrolase
MAQNSVKQVIIMRTDLNMRKGKMIAQGAHASMAFLTRNGEIIKGTFLNQEMEIDTTALKQWIEGKFTKICLQVDSEAKLQELYDKAEQAGLTVSKIVDSGLTEFNNVPTFTCIAIGPNYSEQIDAITGSLKLL